MLLLIGDLHYKAQDLKECADLTDELVQIAKTKRPACTVLLGDLLHDHERLHAAAMNEVLRLLRGLLAVAPVYVLVGNHDMYNNQVFLTGSHWMNVLKGWEKVVVVDQVTRAEVDGLNVVLAPYVPPGRLVEALDTSDARWRSADLVLAHQEIRGVRLGAIVSSAGDLWEAGWPLLISGHIHEPQLYRPNVLYPGSVRAVGACDTGKRSVVLYSKEPGPERVRVLAGQRSIVNLTVGEWEEDVSDWCPGTTVRVSGSREEIRRAKRALKKRSLPEGVRVVLSQNREERSDPCACEEESFEEALRVAVSRVADGYLSRTYHEVVARINGK